MGQGSDPRSSRHCVLGHWPASAGPLGHDRMGRATHSLVAIHSSRLTSRKSASGSHSHRIDLSAPEQLPTHDTRPTSRTQSIWHHRSEQRTAPIQQRRIAVDVAPVASSASISSRARADPVIHPSKKCGGCRFCFLDVHSTVSR